VASAPSPSSPSPSSPSSAGDAEAVADPAPISGGETLREVTVTSELGFHMRPMQRFIEIAGELQCAVTVQRTDSPENAPVDGSSIFGLMELAAAKGAKLVLRASGPDADAALDRLDAFFQNAFGE
jgi:phosphotransferase system HPr (HPr) family protein